MRKYLITSGCYMKVDGNVEFSGGIRRSDEDTTLETHKPAFFKLWIKSLEISTAPELVFIVDAHSPAIPSLEFDNKFPILWHRRVHNLGHLPGWKDGVLKGAELALWKKLDFVYVEQDCLLWGKNIVDYSREQMTMGLVLGSGEDMTMPIEQSFFIVKYEFLPEFISKIQEIDGSMPEVKYVEWFRDQYDLFPFRGGRQRPLNFETDFGFVQRLNESELRIMTQKLTGRPSIKKGDEMKPDIVLDKDRIVRESEQITGWYDKGELDQLFNAAQMAPANGPFVEIGVFRGRSAALLSHFRDGEDLILCDKNMDPDLTTLWPKNAKRITSKSKIQTWNIALLHIDGDHDAESVLRDLKIALRLQKDGILAMHDFDAGAHPGVKEAWDRFDERNDFESIDAFSNKGRFQVFKRKTKPQEAKPKSKKSVK